MHNIEYYRIRLFRIENNHANFRTKFWDYITLGHNRVKKLTTAFSMNISLYFEIFMSFTNNNSKIKFSN